jgi:putative peptidoglycan lipid II flippase
MSSEHHKLAKHAGIFTGATMLSRILGYFRDTMVAAFFGAGPAADAFYTAFRISNLFRRLLGEGALSASFVPVFSEYTQKQSKEETQRFLNTMFTTLVVILSAITLAGIIFAPQLTRIIARGFDPSSERFQLTVTLTRYMFPFMLFICMAALITGVLNAFYSFFLPAMAPACLSIAEIVYIGGLWALHINGQNAIVGLAISVTIGGFSQFFIHVPALWERGYTLRPVWNPQHEAVKRVGKLILPATLGVAADQINSFVDTMMATFLTVGSVTAMYYSNRVMQLPLALFGIALSQVALPTMSASVARGDTQQVKDTLNFAIRLTLFMILPATTGLIILGHPIVQTLFQYGRFSNEASWLTTWALIAFSLGLFAYSSVKILAATFYAYQTTRIPVIVASSCVGLNVVLNIATLFARRKLSVLHPEWADMLNGRIGIACLALATSISAWVNATTLFILLRKKLGLLGGRRIFNTILKSGLGCGAMAFFCWGVMHLNLHELSFLARHGRVARGVELAVAIAGGSAIYLGLARLMRMEEWGPFWSMLTREHTTVDAAD